MPSPTELLAERISDIETSRAQASEERDARWEDVLRKQRAFNCAGLIAIRVVKSAAAAGNVQCKHAEKQIEAFLSTMQPKPE